MASKEIKVLLKAAKAAVGKKDFQEVQTLCQQIFGLDESNYTAHVFAGLAALELGSHGEAKQHYRTAIELQSGEQLAWKGLAAFYDKCSPVTQDEKLDAVETYKKLLTFVGSDTSKQRSTLRKLSSLLQSLDSHSEAISYYSDLLATYDSGTEESGPPAELWLEIAGYLLQQECTVLPGTAWEMLDRGVAAVVDSVSVASETRMDIHLKYIQRAFSKFTRQVVRDSELEGRIREGCLRVLEHELSSVLALRVLVQIELVDLVLALPSSEDFPLSPKGQQGCVRLREVTGGGEGVGCVGMGAALVAEGKWKEAKEVVTTGISLSPGLCEGWLLSCYIHLHLHDHTTTQQHALQGLKVVRNGPLFAAGDLENNLKFYLAQACLGLKGSEQIEQALSLLMELVQVMSHKSHVMASLVKTHLLQGNLSRAKEVLQGLESKLGGDSHVVLGLQGDIHLAQREFTEALEMFTSALFQQPGFAEYHFAQGRTLWEMPSGDKIQAYSAFLQAAKHNPFNPDVFLRIGNYQRLVTRDFKRAAKCYQKAIDLQPNHSEAAIALGDVLFASGDEEGAFNVYRQIVSVVPPTKAKQAWLRMGLYQRKSGQYTDAIKSFQSTLAADPSDKHSWECLGEAYLKRGSHSSALKAFSKAVELDPHSLYCLYQMACIKQLLGLLEEAVSEYTAVLQIEPSYVPALKGRGESHLQLAKQSLEKNFDGRAVDQVSSALRDLTLAARLRPQFVCLWKLIGDCCVCLHSVAPEVARPRVPNVLTGSPSSSPEECGVTEKRELLLTGCRAYGRALQLSPDSANLWHDLALAYYHLGHAAEVTDGVKRREYLHTALNAMKKAVSLQPNNHSHWNALGVIAALTEVESLALAQHAFIKSLQEEPNNVVAWTNLGTLYMKQGNVKLAYEAFKNAQSLEPGYVQAWIGQALVAESIGHAEAMDLFRHASELAYHPEGSMGYGYWVCYTLGTVDRKFILNPGGISLNPIAQCGMLQARDCLQKYVEREKEDACGYNFLGLLYEQEGLLDSAEKAFSRALDLLKEGSIAYFVAVKANHARVLSVLGRSSDALSALAPLTQQDGGNHTHNLQLALALFRGQKLSESLQAYEQALTLLSEEEHKSAILSAEAMVAFAQGNQDQCKTLLFKAFQTPSPSLHGLISLCVFGCLSSDLTLIQAVLQEISRIIEWQADASALLHPSCLLALQIMDFIFQQKHQATETLHSLLEKLPHYSQPTMPPPLPLTLHSLREQSQPEALVLAQKLVHTYPSDPWSLAILTWLLDNTAPALKSKYQQNVLYHVQVQQGAISSKAVRSRKDQSWQKELLSLQKWVHDIV